MRIAPKVVAAHGRADVEVSQRQCLVGEWKRRFELGGGGFVQEGVRWERCVSESLALPYILPGRSARMQQT